MSDRTFLGWPFFEARHRQLAEMLEAWAGAHLPVDHGDVDGACLGLVKALGEAGILRHSGGEALDVRSLCLIRESLARHKSLARHNGLADFSFLMQGLGMGAVSLFGSPAQRQWLEETRAGRAIYGFMLTEPEAGSDVANMATTAVREAGGFVLNGEKTWISNGGIADVYTVIARTGEAPGARGLSAFLVPADTPGLQVVERLEVIAFGIIIRVGQLGITVMRQMQVTKPVAGNGQVQRQEHQRLVQRPDAEWMPMQRLVGQRRMQRHQNGADQHGRDQRPPSQPEQRQPPGRVTDHDQPEGQPFNAVPPPRSDMAAPADRRPDTFVKHIHHQPDTGIDQRHDPAHRNRSRGNSPDNGHRDQTYRTPDHRFDN